MRTDPGLVLSLALDGDDVTCVEALGIRRHLVIQRALRLLDDPAVELEHPELVRRMRDHAERLRAKRSATRLR